MQIKLCLYSKESLISFSIFYKYYTNPIELMKSMERNELFFSNYNYNNSNNNSLKLNSN
jgi:hypothetical protein